MRIEAELEEDQAWALAEFLKRPHPDDFALRAGDRAEADLMRKASSRVRH